MSRNVLNKMIKDIEETVKASGGIHEFIDDTKNKKKTEYWLKSIVDIVNTQNSKNGFGFAINHQKYKNCYFKVGTYLPNHKALFIAIYGIKSGAWDIDEYLIDTVSVYNSRIDYKNDRITIKEEFVPILRNLGIILDDRKIFVPKSNCRDTMDFADKTFVLCTANIKKLKEYSKDWNYQYE